MKREGGPIGQIDPSKEVHIIGAGVSGLLMGHYLTKSGLKVTIFDKSSRPGGKIQTEITQDGPVEKAANAIFTNPDVLELLKELNLDYQEPAPKLKKKLWRFGKARSFPLNLREVFGVINRLSKPVPRDIDEISMQGFFAQVLGDRCSYEVLSAVFGGIYATDARTLHFKSVFKDAINSHSYYGFFKELKNARKASGHKSKSISFDGGMETFIKALSKNLNIVSQEKIEIDSNVNTIICTDAKEASKLLNFNDPESSTLLEKINYQELSTSTYFFKRAVKNLEGSFGVLFPPRSGFKASGILHNSAIYDNRTSSNELRSYTFICPSEDYSMADALADIGRLDAQKFSSNDISSSAITNWKRAIPLYDLARYEAISKIRVKFKNNVPGVVLFGNYVDGISIREMTTSAKNFASNLA